MRHGQAKSNVKEVCSCWPETFKNPLTIYGKEMVRESAEKLEKSLILKGQTVDLIFSSDLLRAQQTANIVGKIFGVKPKFDERLREINFGVYNGKNLIGMWKFFKKEEERIKKAPPGGESYNQIVKRIMGAIKDIEKKYKGRIVVLVSHEGPLFLLQGRAMGLSVKETIENVLLDKRIHKAEIRELN